MSTWCYHNKRVNYLKQMLFNHVQNKIAASTVQRRVISSRFSCKSDVPASNLLGNLEEMLSQYYVYSDGFKFQTTLKCVTRQKGLMCIQKDSMQLESALNQTKLYLNNKT